MTSRQLCVTGLDGNSGGKSIKLRGRNADINIKLSAWFGWSRPPFHTIGIIPFILGTFLVWRLNHAINITIFILGLCGILLAMVSSYHASLYFGNGEDERSGLIFQRRFAVPSGAMPNSLFSDRITSLRISIAAIVPALLIGLFLQFALRTGPLTLPLCVFCALPGFLYRTGPFHLDETGFGELFIGLCYGWFPTAAAFYLQRSYIPPCLHWMALPIGLSIFNVILLKEFHDHAADLSLNKTNLLVRVGKTRGGILYGLVSILSWLALYASLGTGIPRKALYFYLPVMALSAGVSIMMARKKYENPLTLELINGCTITVYLGTTAAYVLAFL